MISLNKNSANNFHNLRDKPFLYKNLKNEMKNGFKIQNNNYLNNNKGEIIKEVKKYRLKVKNFEEIALNKKEINNYYLIGQFDRKFLILKNKISGNLLIFDQHAVHERVMYESLKSILFAKLKFEFNDLKKMNLKKESMKYKKRDLIPNFNDHCLKNSSYIDVNTEILFIKDLNKEYDFLFSKVYCRHSLKDPISLDIKLINLDFNFLSMKEFKKYSILNFEIERKRNTLIISKVPIVFNKILDKFESIELLLNIFNFFSEIFYCNNNIERDLNFDEIINENKLKVKNISFLVNFIFVKFLKTKACRSSIRFGDRLDFFISSKIIKHLFNCFNPFTCAHGRYNFFIIKKQ